MDSTGLEYIRARYYDPATGRFLSQDPLPLLQRYAYVGNGNLTDRDASGRYYLATPNSYGPGSYSPLTNERSNDGLFCGCLRQEGDHV